MSPSRPPASPSTVARPAARPPVADDASPSTPEPCNLAVLVGSLSSDPVRRELPSGEHLASFEVTVPRAGDRAESVPVVWFNAPGLIDRLAAGDWVAVVGRVRRRFFRAAATTQSRTEVVAERLVPVTRRADVDRLLGRARDRLDRAA